MLTAGSRVIAVIPTLGANPDRLDATLRAALASDVDADIRLDVVVVWNDPRRPERELPGVRVLRPGLNLGFAGALNHARSRVQAEFLWVLQDDVRPAPDCLERLLERMQAPDRPAVASPVMLDAAGLVPAHSRGGVLGPDGAMDHWFPVTDTPPAELDLDHPLDFVASSGTLARLEAWDQVGGFDPDFYPVSWSDVDFCHRLRRAGHRLALVPEAVIAHDRNASTSALFGQFLGAKNGERFRAKHVHGHPPAPLDVDSDLAQQIARSASLVLVDFVGHATEAHRTAVASADQIQTTLRAELLARDHHIADLEGRLSAAVSGLAARDRRIRAQQRKARTRERRVAELQAALGALRSSRAVRFARILRNRQDARTARRRARTPPA